MKLLHAIIQTIGEWNEIIVNSAKGAFTKSNITGLLWAIWIFGAPIIVTGWMVYAYAAMFNMIILAGFFIGLIWCLFWFDVYGNMGVTNISHYDEKKKQWVEDYTESEKK
jgi:hypothetical protein